MKITHVSIKNFRSLKDVDIDVNDYTALIGANGSGKSCVLYALDWFFNGQPLQPSDITGYENDGSGLSDDDRTISVTVTFDSLTNKDRKRLEQYGRRDTASFRRSWTLGDSKDKVVGNTTQGPGFAGIRQMSKITDIRPAYVNLRTTLTELPNLGSSPSKDQVYEALVSWENDARNSVRLVDIDNDDANHMFGYNGPNIIKDCVRLVLVPAAADIASQVGSSSGKSALGELIGSLMSKASAEAKAAWLTENTDRIEELNRLVRAGIEQSTGIQENRINNQLNQLVPTASVKFIPEVPDWTPKSEATVMTNVTIDGVTNDVSKQGHGIQRAVMIAMFQSLVPDESFITARHEQLDDETEEDAELRLQEELENLPALIVCIEEPEIYQHPIRARAFARILTEITKQTTTQIIVATHSPYFVLPSQFTSLRRFHLNSGKTAVNSTNLAAVASTSSSSKAQVQKIIEKRLPTTFSEGFFCDAVVIVEGDTDKIVIETLADKLNLSLDSKGISVLEMSGKGSLKIPSSMLSGLNIPTYVIADGDALGAARTHPSDSTKQAAAHLSHQQATDNLLAWLPNSNVRYGSLPYAFGDNTVIADDFSIWEDDIEEELNKWPSFIAALTVNGSRLRSKDLLAYRTAVIEADATDCPDQLKECIEAIVAFGTA